MNTYTIDVPPSANAIWRNVKGRTLKSRLYRQWLDKARWMIFSQHDGEPLAGPTTVQISLRRPRANADLDNRIKPTLDALQSGKAIANDKQVTSIHAAWADHDGCRVTVTPDVAA